VSIDVGHLRECVVRPTLVYLAESNLMPHSRAAENLVLGTALVESKGRYLRQLGAGPALGLWQMEAVTHDDIWKNWLGHPARLKLAQYLSSLTTVAPIMRGAFGMVGNLCYGAGMCRLHYRRQPDALPPADDALGMARLWKARYNTPRGAGSVDKALPFFAQVCRT